MSTTAAASSYTQERRRLRIDTPLGDDALLLLSFTGQEEMSRPFAYELSLASTKDSIAAKDIVGKNVTFSVEFEDGTPRFFNGYVSRFAYLGTDDRLSRYYAQVVPWLWFLTRSSDCRIFQNKDVKEIIEQIFSDLGFKDFDTSGIAGSHPKWEYCVQYRETAFNFISRLMEKEGIFYFFRHDDGKHTMVLADSKAAYKDLRDKEAKFAANLSAPDASDTITQWEHRYEYRSGKWTHADYNFETPSTSLRADVNTILKLDNINIFEFYDYPGGYLKKPEGDASVKVRMEEEEAGYEVVRGAGSCRSFSPGGKFKLSKHYVASEAGKSYVVTAVGHSASVGETYISGGGGDPGYYTNTFTAIPDSVVFRPPRTTPKPLIHGAQTAVVVGPAGEEIYADKYGRVKVQFYWDRDGKKDDKSTCFIRVAQPLAGKGWGAVFLPRISHEVLVSFLEGDPDRPLITGSVYNAENMPPYALPDNKTMSLIKSNSSKGGKGFNEIRFEDKKGEEQIFIHAEKNQDIRVKNDRFETIGHDRNLVVDNDKLEHVKNNREELVDNDHKEEIKNDRNLKVGGKEAKEVTGSHSFKVTGDVIEVFKANHSEETTGDYYLKADNIVIEAMTNLTIKVGQSYIAIESSGLKIGTTGTIELESTGETKIKGTAGLKMEGTGGAELKGATLSLKGDGTLTVKGGVVMIN